MTKKFIKASSEMQQDCLKKANAWHAEPNQKMFGNEGTLAVAEYLANERGCTLYNCNASYPKESASSFLE